MIKNPTVMQKTQETLQVRSLGWEDSLEKEMATHSSPLALKTPWMEELGAGSCPWGCKESSRLSDFTSFHLATFKDTLKSVLWNSIDTVWNNKDIWNVFRF